MINSHNGQMGGWMNGRADRQVTDCILMEGCMASPNEGFLFWERTDAAFGVSEGGVPWVTVSPMAME